MLIWHFTTIACVCMWVRLYATIWHDVVLSLEKIRNRLNTFICASYLYTLVIYLYSLQSTQLLCKLALTAATRFRESASKAPLAANPLLWRNQTDFAGPPNQLAPACHLPSMKISTCPSLDQQNIRKHQLLKTEESYSPCPTKLKDL